MIFCATDAWFILCTNKIYAYVFKKSDFIFPITKGSVNALMKLAAFNTSNKVKNHWFRGIYLNGNKPRNVSLSWIIYFLSFFLFSKPEIAVLQGKFKMAGEILVTGLRFRVV